MPSRSALILGGMRRAFLIAALLGLTGAAQVAAPPRRRR